MSISTRHIYFPYCLHQRNDKLWVILNRNYKPLGTMNDDWSDYEALPAEMCIKSISSAQAKKISYSGESDNTFRIYLYDDGCIPTDSKINMEAYLNRLSVLMKLNTKRQN